MTITLQLSPLFSYISALPHSHTVAVNLNTEIMAALCHSMTFTFNINNYDNKNNFNLGAKRLPPTGFVPPSPCPFPLSCLVCFYYCSTVLDPLPSVFLFSPSRADTLTSSVPSDLLNPVVYSAIDAPGFDERCRNKSFSRCGSSSRPFVSKPQGKAAGWRQGRSEGYFIMAWCSQAKF